MTEREGKALFAELTLRQPGAFQECAQAVASMAGITDVQMIYNMAVHWPGDPEVKLERDRLLTEKGPEHFLPGKVEVAQRLWAKSNMQSIHPEVQLQFLKEYIRVMNMVPKDAPPPVTVAVLNKVMVVPALGNDDDWERRLERNQTSLIEHVK